MNDDEMARQRQSQPDQDLRSKRLDRLNECDRAALELADAFDANLKAILARMMRMSDYVASVVEDNIPQVGTSLSGFESIQPAVDAYTKLAREAEKLARFTTRHEQDAAKLQQVGWRKR